MIFDYHRYILLQPSYVVLESTHLNALDTVPLDVFVQIALDVTRPLKWIMWKTR
jgi:hypothetical protein